MNDDHLGTVYLVGAGPGDPDLLTVKANRLLSQCDAIVYDALVPNEMLNLVKNGCKSIFVGKRRNHHSTSQELTNELLRDLAYRYQCIVRLKGGDPFVFGRGGEEANYLQRHGIAVEVVPGITSGIAAPSYVGIPLTHRLVGSSVTFVTGHEGFNKKRPLVNWRDLAKATNTLVIYMGVHNLTYIVQELLAGGLSPHTPSAVIQQGTIVGQRFLKTSLEKLSKEVEEENFAAPSIVIIGEIVDYQVALCAPLLASVTMPTLS